MTNMQMTEGQMVEELETEQSMFVQTAGAITSDGTTLTLKDVTHRRSTSPTARSGLWDT